MKIIEREVTTEKWKSRSSLKIALLADIHLIWPWMTPSRLSAVVDHTNRLRPDLVLLLGDYVGTHLFGLQIDPERGLAPLSRLRAPCGVYAVLGNHDLKSPGGWAEALTETGIPVLENQARFVDCAGHKFWIAGLEDYYWGTPDVGKTLEQVADDHPVIMMMHNPDSFPDVPASVALSVAGHTHGGQIRLPFIGAVSAVIPSRFGKRYAYGHVAEAGKDLVVSGGLGMTGIPVRFMMPPEIVLVTLRNSKPRQAQWVNDGPIFNCGQGTKLQFRRCSPCKSGSLGAVAEWQGRGLQILPRGFDSCPCLPTYSFGT